MGVKINRRFVLPVDSPVPQPLAVETIGLNPEQEPILRKDGYPYYHWLQTTSGEGVAEIAGQTVSLPANTGILLFPGEPHAYESAGDSWETAYLTFGGSLADRLLASLGIRAATVYRLPPDAGAAKIIEQAVAQLAHKGDVFGVETSTAAYKLLLTLARYGDTGGKKKRNPERTRRLREAVEWMEQHCADADLGVRDIAAAMGLSERRLADLFRDFLGQPPYAYFLQLRIRKAKELLVRSSAATIREIAGQVGFRDASHFVATFRKHVGLTPEQFRRSN